MNITPDTPNPRLPTVLPRHMQLAMREDVPEWEKASNRAREVAKHRLAIVCYIRSHTKRGVTQNNAIGFLFARFDSGDLDKGITGAMVGAAKKGRDRPSDSTIAEWCKVYKDAGYDKAALLPGHRGRSNPPKDWWPLAMDYYNQPTKPSYAAVCRWLTDEHGFEVTCEQVKGYLKALPSQYGKKGAARLGKNLHKLTQKPYKTRTTENMIPGEIYAADGYSIDVYLAHPVSGDIWRMEMTAAIDVRSRWPVGWRSDEHEGTVAVQHMWAEAFTRWEHLPHSIYVDNGSGHKNRLMNDELTGFYVHAGIEPIYAIPGNPHGKGWIERFFRTVRDDFLKLWRPQFYCGDDMAKEAKDKTFREIEAGRLQLPTLAEFTEDFNKWLATYVQRKHPEANAQGKTIAEMWAGLEPVKPHHSLVELKRQHALLPVRRARMIHQNREYTHPTLYAFNGQKLVLEFDLEDDRVGIVRTQEGVWICDAHLVSAIDVIAPNRLEEKRQKRAVGQIKRGEKKISEIKARAGLVIDAEAVAVGGMEALEGEAKLLPNSSGDTFSLDDFND